MKTKLQKAIANNNGLYQAIFAEFKINSEKSDFIWYCLRETPPLYSNLVTISKKWKLDEIFQQIDTNFVEENWEEWSIKDSFAVLDLTEFGFSKLFNANWFYLEAENLLPISKNKVLHYEVVENKDVLAKWKLAWDIDKKLGDKIFNSGLLQNPDVYFVAGFEKNKVVSGCFLNKTDDVLGISNFFAPNENISYWSDLIEFVQNSIERKDIVGYERKKLVEKLVQLGFENIGNLTVWLKKQR